MNKVLFYLTDLVHDAQAVWRLILIKVVTFLKKIHLIPPIDDEPEDKEFEARYKKHNDEFNEFMKKKHPFLHYFKKAEPFIMWFGFFTFILDPFVEMMFVAGFGEDGGGALHAITRGIQGGAMGLGFANWLRSSSDDKMRFRMMDYVNNFFKQIHEIMEEADAKMKQEHLNKVTPKRAD